MTPVQQFAVKITLGFVALVLYVLSTPINGGAPVFAFAVDFQAILVVAIVGAFGWAATQGGAAVSAVARLDGFGRR